jgi:hypothetical protein
MHFALSPELFKDLRRLTMPGGTVVANFHKGWGFESARDHLGRTPPADSLTLVAYDVESPHGPTAAWKKVNLHV